jgi:microcystin degradation protein MlrC
MRLAVGQLSQETNTFSPLPTTRQDFEDFGIFRGADAVARMAQTNELGGFIQSLGAWTERPEIVGLARLSAWPSGPITRPTFDWLRGEVVDSLHRAGPLHGVLLALHGAMVADAIPDVSGVILAAVRAHIGPYVPLVVTLDLHANITAKMVKTADVLVTYHTAPHIDVFETGQRGAAVLRRIAIDGARPLTAFQKMPMVVPPERANTQDPASISHHFCQILREIEAQPNALAAGLATVQPWLDIPELGNAIVVVTDGDAEQATQSCASLAAQMWDRRGEYLPDLVPVEEAVHEAFERQREGLVVLSDGADSTNSGAPGDSTWVLRELVKYRWSRGALVTIVAPEIVADTQRLGVGAERIGPVGGLRDHLFSQPFSLTAKVVRLFDARFVLTGHLGKNLPIDMGPSAVVRHGDVALIVTSRSGPHFAPELFRSAGFDPFAASVLVAKSPCGFRAAYQARAAKIINLCSGGCAPADFWRYAYRNIPQPLWPWQEVQAWSPAPSVYPPVEPAGARPV